MNFSSKALSKIDSATQALFIKKFTVLIAGTLLLVPLVYFKLQIPALLYIGGLVILHVVFLYVYFVRTPWKEFMRHKAEFALRVVSVAFLIYLLTLVKFEGDFWILLRNTLIALGIHLCILIGMMVRRHSVASHD
jgi:hypothetical protein